MLYSSVDADDVDDYILRKLNAAAVWSKRSTNASILSVQDMFMINGHAAAESMAGCNSIWSTQFTACP